MECGGSPPLSGGSLLPGTDYSFDRKQSRCDGGKPQGKDDDIGTDRDDRPPVDNDVPEADDVPEPPKEARAERGKIYLLGKHRVMCGDSTDGGDVALLMDGKKAELVYSDPPYGIQYDGGLGSERDDALALLLCVRSDQWEEHQ